MHATENITYTAAFETAEVAFVTVRTAGEPGTVGIEALLDEAPVEPLCVSPASGGGIAYGFPPGTEVTFDPQPDDAVLNAFARWSLGIVSTVPAEVITLEADIEVQAHFEGKRTITLLTTGSGDCDGTVALTVTGASGRILETDGDEYTITENATLTLTPTADSECAFDYWEIGAEEVLQSPYTGYLVAENANITAHFAIGRTLHLVIPGTGAGTLDYKLPLGTGVIVTPPNGTAVYYRYTLDITGIPHGRNVELQAGLNPDLRFINWIGGGLGDDNREDPVNVLMDGDKTVYANIRTIFHTGDYDHGGIETAYIISLAELLTAITYYNIPAGFECNPGVYDGYQVYTEEAARNITCGPHDLDYSPQDWHINISELLRLIQFYNIRDEVNEIEYSYHPCPDEGTEDGFCPGDA